MIETLVHDGEHDQHLQEILLDYVEALQAKRQPDREAILAAHPELRADLEAFFADYEDVECLTAPLRVAAREETDASPFAPCSDAGSQLVFDAGSQPTTLNAPPEIGRLGDFRLLREVGRGGMGVVYEAEQLSLQRRVALKVLPFAAALDPRQLQRFKNEAMAAGHLRHEHIVPVYAVGCERGVHYYAMQFVEGQSLAALIQELHLDANEPGTRAPQQLSRSRAADDTVAAVRHDRTTETPASAPKSSVAEETAASLSRVRGLGRRQYFEWVAGIGRQAALALDYAHQAGIVHRDVKPANLLLDERGHLWVTDFGLAQMTGDGGLTVTGELVGTIRYASPEQVHARRGVTDQRSDIYSLGATLYELLTLRPIFDGRDRNELLLQIGNEEPRSPRSCDAAIPTELETIVFKALNKDQVERYHTAQDLADDLQCFLDNRPIQAQRPTVFERTWKWSRRHPAIVATAAAVLLVVSTISLLSAALIRGEQQRAEQAFHSERQRAEEAEARFQLARRSVDELIAVSQEELADRPGMAGLRRRLLMSALAYYQEFIEQRRDNPDAQAELIETTKHVEKILADLAVLRFNGQLHLLCQRSVLDDLLLKGRQRSKVWELTARIGKQWAEERREASRLPPAERSRRALERARANETEVNAILTAEQQKRLRQIALQMEGPSAFHEPEVALALQLTTEQRERIRAIQDEAMFEWMKTVRDGKSQGNPMQAADPYVRTTTKQIVALLTEDQLRRWNVMTGPAFRGRLMPFPAPVTPNNGQSFAP